MKNINSKTLAGIAFFFMVSSPLTLFVSKGFPSDGPVDKGKATFQEKCSACHTIGEGKKVGPDLKGITESRSRQWLENFISNPESMFKSGDPLAIRLLKDFGNLPMPNLGLSKEQVSYILVYLKSETLPSQASSMKKAEEATEMGPPLGEKEGEELFTGLEPFQNGGPPCVSCHNISAIPFPGGGTLGPDLSGAYSKFGSTEMNSILAILPFSTMTPLFSGHSLTLEEQQNLGAFFKKSATQPSAQMTLKISLSAIGGLFILIILAWRVWHRRLRSVRKALVTQALKTGVGR